VPAIADAQAFPAVGVANGIAFETVAGVRIWYPATDEVVTYGTKPAFVGDGRKRMITWCEERCTALHITRIGGRDLVVDAPDGRSFDLRGSKFSPDGQRLAVSADNDSSGVLVLVDTHMADASTVVYDLGSYGTSIGWSAGARQLFFSSNSYMEPTSEVGRVDLRSRRVQRATLPFGGALSFVPLTRDEARPLLRAMTSRPDSCPPPTIQPSRRTGACGFTFSVKPGATSRLSVPAQTHG
jgi:hypothetical protein